MSNLRKKIIIDSSGNEKFINSNAGYIENAKVSSASANSGIVNVTTTATTIIASNSDRKSVFIKNQSATPVIIKYASNPTTTDYYDILSASSGLRKGDGGSHFTNEYTGSIVGIVETGTADVSIIELEV